MAHNVRSPAAQAAFDSTPQGRYIIAMRLAQKTSQETAAVAQAAADLAERDWGGTDNRVLIDFADDVGKSALATSKVGVTGWAIATARNG